MRIASRLAASLGALGIAAAVVFVLWPLDARGVTGTALTPHYRPFGWYS